MLLFMRLSTVLPPSGRVLMLMIVSQMLLEALYLIVFVRVGVAMRIRMPMAVTMSVFMLMLMPVFMLV